MTSGQRSIQGTPGGPSVSVTQKELINFQLSKKLSKVLKKFPCSLSQLNNRLKGTVTRKLHFGYEIERGFPEEICGCDF